MRRIIEKLAQKRRKKEEEFSDKLKTLEKKSQQDLSLQNSRRFQDLLKRLEKVSKSKEAPPQKKTPGLIPSISKLSKDPSTSEKISQEAGLILTEFQGILDQNFAQIKELICQVTELVRLNSSLADARDREWDALGSNHVGMIFKSMEWRVDKLAAEYEDVKILMKKFLFLKEQLNKLLSVLEEKKTPSPPQVKEILEPLEDWQYAGFENRFRGYETEVKKQQVRYLPYFKKKGKVLDLGCGRGEFLELLEKNGLKGVGIDINDQMIDICLEKGLDCQKGDILEKLAEHEDGSLSGIFSSQVIEHLPPSYLKRLVEMAYFKLASSSCIVLETINPVSVFSLVEIYFLDLSHQKPIHPQAIKFLMENTGFDEVEIVYSSPVEAESLQDLPGSDEAATILNQNIDKLNKLLYAPSNYAAIGKKA
ncbi:MAG: methyltransferase domain-containing protein [Candidatus Aminicenantes bacterium]|nr:methyltransferase domain-containing protein [Candidatus Aminicenantes bacterium]